MQADHICHFRYSGIPLSRGKAWFVTAWFSEATGVIDFNSKSGLSDRINYHIDQALVTAHQFEPGRSYLGGSRIGHHCERALQYEFCKVPVDPDKAVDGRIVRIFARGHWNEAAMIGWLRDAGFGVIKGDRDGGQFGPCHP